MLIVPGWQCEHFRCLPWHCKVKNMGAVYRESRPDVKEHPRNEIFLQEYGYSNCTACCENASKLHHNILIVRFDSVCDGAAHMRMSARVTWKASELK